MKAAQEEHDGELLADMPLEFPPLIECVGPITEEPVHDIKDVCKSQFPDKWKMNESEFEKCSRVVGQRHGQSLWLSLM